MINGILKQVQGWVKLKGSDGTTIGSTGDKLHVTNTPIASTVDSNNSTSAPLGISGVFTGTWDDVLNHTNFSVILTTDEASATDGLEVQYSSDGVNIDSTDNFTIAALAQKQYSFGVTSQYVRVVYTNGVDAQSYFRMQVIHHTSAPKPSSHRIDDSVIAQDDAELTKSVITGQKPDGSFTNVQVTAGGNFKVSLEEMDPAVETEGVNLPVFQGKPMTPLEVSDDLTSASDTVVFDNALGYSSLGLQVSGTWVGEIDISMSVDGTNYENIEIFRPSNETSYKTIVGNGLFERNIGGVVSIKATMTAYTSGTATVVMRGTSASTNTMHGKISTRENDGGTSGKELLTVINTSHNKIHEGRMYHFSEFWAAGSGVARRFFFDPATSAHLIFQLLSSEGATFTLYEDPTGVTTSTAYNLVNHARFSSSTTSSTMELVTGFSTLGTVLEQLDTGSVKNANFQSQRTIEWVLSSSHTYIFEVTSNINNNDLTLLLDFYQNS